MVQNFKELLKEACERESKVIAVAVPEELEVLEVIEKAEEINLAEFILIGDEEKINKIIKEHNLKIKGKVIDEKDHAKAAAKAVDLVDEKKAATVMKGMLHSATFLKAVLNKEKSLNIGNKITQISIFEKEEGGFLFLTDCAISVEPDLNDKKGILENAVSLFHKMGVEEPKVAILTSLEVVNPKMQDTIDAAVLSKMNDRSQIKGCIVDGPFAFDNAVSKEAAEAKGLKSPVAGQADVILVPNLTVGNSISKALTFIGKKQSIAATVGTSVPIIFTSRTETMEGKLLSIALAAYTS